MPTTLIVHLIDGEVTDVAVPAVRNKWARVGQVLLQLDWARVEGRTKNGMCGIYEHPDLEALMVPTELEDIPADKATAQVAGLLKMVIYAQDIAVQRLGDYHARVLEQMGNVVEILSDAVVRAESSAADNAHLAAELMKAAAASGEGDDSDIGGALLRQVLPQLESGARKRKPRKKPDAKS